LTFPSVKILCRVTQRKRIAEVVAATEQMLWGSLGEVYRRCGQPTCHCATGEKHGPVFYLTRNEGGRTRNIYVPPELHKEVAAGLRPTAVIESWGSTSPRLMRCVWGWGRSGGGDARDRTTAPAA
jgi:hypothetical protein